MRRLKYTCTGRRLSLMPLCHKNDNHALCYARLCQGLHSTAIKSDHLLGRSAPRTYSTICISSESCLGSLVGFARLPCFGTLHSVPSTKVRWENYYDCVPDLPDEHLSRESRKPTVMMQRELVSCSRGCKILKDLFRITPL